MPVELRQHERVAYVLPVDDPYPSKVESGTCLLEVFAVNDADPASTRPLPSPFVIDGPGHAIVVKGEREGDGHRAVWRNP